MIQKISDFKIAEFLLRAFCTQNKVTFIDLPVKFIQGISSYNGNALMVCSYDKFSQTCFSIIGCYVKHINLISSESLSATDEEMSNFLIFAAAILRDLTYSKSSTTKNVRTTVSSRLNRNPLIWLLLRDIFCPVFSRPLKNISVLASRSGTMDGAVYVKEGIGQITDPTIFINLELDNAACRDAYLLFEALRAHNLNPESVLNEAFNKTEISTKLIGLAKSALVSNEAVNDFLMTLCLLSNYKATDSVLINEASNKWNSKTGLWAQAQSKDAWWYLGLIEKMLEPARGPDWTGYFTSKPWIEDLWERVEDERKRRGLKELPMEILLRVQGDEFKQRSDLTIQGLLADNRVW
jgi:hypothetical protein